MVMLLLDKMFRKEKGIYTVSKRLNGGRDIKPCTHIQYTSTSASADIDFLTQQINQERPEFGSAYPFAFFIRDEKNKITTGCNGSVIFGSIYTD